MVQDESWMKRPRFVLYAGLGMDGLRCSREPTLAQPSLFGSGSLTPPARDAIITPASFISVHKSPTLAVAGKAVPPLRGTGGLKNGIQSKQHTTPPSLLMPPARTAETRGCKAGEGRRLSGWVDRDRHDPWRPAPPYLSRDMWHPSSCVHSTLFVKLALRMQPSLTHTTRVLRMKPRRLSGICPWELPLRRA